MEINNFLKSASSDEISKKIASLAASSESDSLEELSAFLKHMSSDTYDKHVIPYLACRGLLHKGEKGVRKLIDTLNEIDGSIYPHSIIKSLWAASNGKLNNFLFNHMNIYSPLDNPLSDETIDAAKDAFYEFIINCHTDAESFYRFSHFLYMQNLSVITSGDENEVFSKQILSIFSDSTIKITKGLIDNFSCLIEENLKEEEYQKFLESYPVFIDPLAANVYNKHKLGDDLITDFVVETLRSEYVLVEIEKPHDKIFTSKGDFTSAFIHAYGQVIDFIEWIEVNISYAQKKLPQIASPKGLLIIGRTKGLNDSEIRKLRRFNKNSNSIEVLTFDDILIRAMSLYKNLKR